MEKKDLKKLTKGQLIKLLLKKVSNHEDLLDNDPFKIKELNRALKGYAKPYEIELQDNSNPLNHFTKTRPQTESHLEDLLKTMKGFKFIEALEVTFVKDTIDSKTGKCGSIYKQHSSMVKLKPLLRLMI